MSVIVLYTLASRHESKSKALPCVLGVPYAEPPVGSFRFSPPRSPQPWRGVRQSQEFAPVCPQVLPNLREEVKPGRYEYLERHLPYLRNQSEDCLYLNIYAPHQAEGKVQMVIGIGVAWYICQPSFEQFICRNSHDSFMLQMNSISDWGFLRAMAFQCAIHLFNSTKIIP